MLRNTTTYYGSVAKWLHWLTAFSILGAYVFVYARYWFLDGTPHQPTRAIHSAIGLSVLLWVSLRLWWKLTNPEPKLPHMPKIQHTASHAMHWVLYFLMFAMPITGYLGSGGSVNYGLFEIPTFRNTGWGQWLLAFFDMTWDEWEVGWDYFHKRIAGALVLWILVVIHAAAAIYHHIVQKDSVLVGMLPGKWARAEKDKRDAAGHADS